MSRKQSAAGGKATEPRALRCRAGLPELWAMLSTLLYMHILDPGSEVGPESSFPGDANVQGS